MMREIIVDSFAGGGGASTGIEMAFGVSPDIAINHDAVALSMHAANHPATRHLPHSIWKVDPYAVCDGRPVGLLWASPDCKHFSKAKGGKPVEKSIRDLAWVVVRWARQVSPRIIILENVEEFSTWGPLAADGRPCPDRKGATFRKWVGELRRLGYKVEYRELRACDYGAPTIRKRLFLIARRDGEPIVWPKPTHGAPTSDGVKTGKLLPWRTAAEIIDWSLPCPSIFDTSAEIMAKYGLRAVRPLQPATMARIAKGIKRYVLDAAKPFIIQTGYGERAGQAPRVPDVDSPLGTVVAGGVKHAAVQPFVMPITHTRDPERGQAINDPLCTITAAHRGEQALVAPFVTGVGGRMGQTEPRGADQPAQTLTAKADSVIVAPVLSAYYGKGTGEDGRAADVADPVKTVTTENRHAVIAPHLMTMRNAGKPFNGADEPTHTITSGGAHLHLVAAFLAQHNIDSRTGEGNPGRPVDAPVSTVLQSGSHQGLVAANLLRQFGTGVGSSLDEPARTVMADGAGKTQLSAAFISKYYGTGEGQAASDSVHTVTTKDRMGVVTVMIDGEPYAITDIGMRMLTPRELFRAQGFPETYIIDRGVAGEAITKTEQVSKCGNSVCPPMAAALVAANFAPRDIDTPDDREFFLEAAE